MADKAPNLLDRTPREIRDDAALWARAGFPSTACGRYRDAADQIERLIIQNEQQRDKLREWAKECAECDGTGCLLQPDDTVVDCGKCADIREFF